MNNLFFSVLVPVYNVEKYLHRCINSVLEQTYSNFELILVNDGSLDNSGFICDKYALKDPRITVIHKENGGLISARREAIKNAKGDWCVFLDSDDYINPKTLELINQKALDTKCDCVYYGWNNVDNNENKIGESHDIIKEFFIEDKRKFFNIVFLNDSFNSLCRKAVKRDLLSDTDYSLFYNIKHGEDLLQSLEIFKTAKKVLFLPDHLYNYRVNPTSITHTIDYKKYHPNFIVRKKVLEFLQNENVWQEDDYINYWKYCISLLVSEIRLIVNFDADYKTVRGFFEEILRDEYYQSFLCSKKYKKHKNILLKKDRIIYFLFRNKQYWLLFLLSRIIRKIRNIIKLFV